MTMPEGARRPLALFMAAIAITVCVAANSARGQNFYAIYMSTPIVLFLFLLAFPPAPFNKTLGWKIAKILAQLILLAAALRSISNLLEIQKYTSLSMPAKLCFGQQMDKEMRATSIGQCENFNIEQKN